MPDKLPLSLFSTLTIPSLAKFLMPSFTLPTVSMFNDEFSSSTKPALMTNDGDPFLYSIYDISSCSVEYGMERTMSFKFGANLFDVTQKIAEFDSIRAIGYVGNSNYLPTFPVLSEDGIDLISYVNQSWQDTLNVDIIFDATPTQQILNFDTDDNGEDEYYFVNNYELSIISPDAIKFGKYSSNLSDAPLFIEEFQTLVIPADNELYFNNTIKGLLSAFFNPYRFERELL